MSAAKVSGIENNATLADGDRHLLTGATDNDTTDHLLAHDLLNEDVTVTLAGRDEH